LLESNDFTSFLSLFQASSLWSLVFGFWFLVGLGQGGLNIFSLLFDVLLFFCFAAAELAFGLLGIYLGIYLDGVIGGSML
jgi:hypothetical protein